MFGVAVFVFSLTFFRLINTKCQISNFFLNKRLDEFIILDIFRCSRAGGKFCCHFQVELKF